jgi:hypothetical protein
MIVRGRGGVLTRLLFLPPVIQWFCRLAVGAEVDGQGVEGCFFLPYMLS